jgi:hypothetical protein
MRIWTAPPGTQARWAASAAVVVWSGAMARVLCGVLGALIARRPSWSGPRVNCCLHEGLLTPTISSYAMHELGVAPRRSIQNIAIGLIGDPVAPTNGRAEKLSWKTTVP